MDFKNPREVFSHNGMKNKNLSQFFQQELRAGRIEAIFRPFFPFSQLFCYSPDLAGAVTASWGEFGETEGGFCPEHAHIQ
jgi:hypothetical protein